MLHNYRFMEQFRGYTKWPAEVQHVAKERLLHEYFEEELIRVETKGQFLQELREIIIEDLEFYERFEEYEVCQMLKEILEEL